jgi:putative lipoprotein
MKAIIGFTFFLLFLAGIMFATMLDKQPAPNGSKDDMASFAGITWHPVAVGDDVLSEDSGLTIMFAVSGEISGHGGCNGFRGSLERSDTGLVVGPLASTRMACPNEIMDRENAFFEALQRVKRLQGDKLELHMMDENGGVLLVLTAGVQSETEN